MLLRAHGLCRCFGHYRFAAYEKYRALRDQAFNCRTQGTPLGICNGMPKTLSAIAKLLRVRRIPFLGLTKTGWDDSDGRMIAAALEDALPHVSMEQERLNLTQIDFVP